ncbi:MAG: DUF3313 family protein [Pseudomonadota bacterium]
MYRLVTVFALSMLAACATDGGPRLERFNTIEIGGLSDFTAYDKVHLVPSVASENVMAQTEIRFVNSLRGANQDDQPLDEADIRRKLADYDDALKGVLGDKVTLVDQPGPGVLTIRPTVTALEANRPDLTRAGRAYPGFTRVLAVGEAASSFAFSVDGEEIGTLADASNDRVLNDRGFLPLGVWETADRYFNQSASNLGSLF